MPSFLSSTKDIVFQIYEVVTETLTYLNLVMAKHPTHKKASRKHSTTNKGLVWHSGRNTNNKHKTSKMQTKKKT